MGEELKWLLKERVGIFLFGGEEGGGGGGGEL